MANCKNGRKLTGRKWRRDCSMITTTIINLDGPLVQTERLKVIWQLSCLMLYNKNLTIYGGDDYETV